MMDPMHRSRVHSSMTRRFGALLLCFAVACGGGGKKDKTTPGKKTDGSQSMNDKGDPEAPPTGGGAAGTPGAGSGSGSGSGVGGGSDGIASEPGDATPQVTYPNLDPDPAQAKSQVDQHLQIAKLALQQQTPDGDTALKEARLALTFDAANVDAAAMVAFAYYHKKLYETAELVLDDLFKREAAKNNAQVYYVYGLVYDKTNRPDRAQLAFEKAVAIDPNHQSALVNLGVHQLQNGQYDAARQAFEKLTQQFGRKDAVTMTSLGSAYRGMSADFPQGGQRDGYIAKADGAYKRATQANPNYGPAYYNLGLLYLENDPFPGISDPMIRLNAAKGFFDQYKNMPGVDIKLYDDRMKDVTKLIKRQEKLNKKKKKGGDS
jgi:tetratricopeptide (TPR) repeat protein